GDAAYRLPSRRIPRDDPARALHGALAGHLTRMAGSICRGAAAGILAALAQAALAQGAPALDVPVACEMGKACVLQNYVDRDPGPAARDYRCGMLTYDGHKGTDI